MTESAKYGKWEIVEPIGRGGQGQVYLVRDSAAAPNVKDRVGTLKSAVATLVGISEEWRVIELGEEVMNNVSHFRDAFRAFIKAECGLYF